MTPSYPSYVVSRSKIYLLCINLSKHRIVQCIFMNYHELSENTLKRSYKQLADYILTYIRTYESSWYQSNVLMLVSTMVTNRPITKKYFINVKVRKSECINKT